jgi:hypothetical protein
MQHPHDPEAVLAPPGTPTPSTDLPHAEERLEGLISARNNHAQPRLARFFQLPRKLRAPRLQLSSWLLACVEARKVIVRWPALDNVAEGNVLAGETSSKKHLVEKLAGAPDKALTSLDLLCARSLSKKTETRPWSPGWRTVYLSEISKCVLQVHAPTSQEAPPEQEGTPRVPGWEGGT